MEIESRTPMIDGEGLHYLRGLIAFLEHGAAERKREFDQAAGKNPDSAALEKGVTRSD